jgi:glycerol-3-phosphate dehydrogenase (NAD(P)+)
MIVRVMGDAIPKLAARDIISPHDFPLLQALIDIVVHELPIELPLDAFFQDTSDMLWHQPTA